MNEDKRFYEIADDNRVVSGIASALYVKNASGKYSILLPLETVPSFASNPESIEFDVTTSATKGKLAGKTALEDKEVEFFYHRDNVRRLKALKGKVVELMKVMPDFTAEKITAEVSYISNDSTSADPNKGTIKVTPRTFDGDIDNCYDLLQRTCKFVTPIDGIVYLEVAGTFEKEIGLNPANGTFTAVSDTVAVATVAVASNKVTITSVAQGTAVITLTSSATDCASWTTTIVVIVE